MVYDEDSLQILNISNAPGIMGTYNYVPMPAVPNSVMDVGGWLNFGIRGIGRGAVDVLPSVFGGNIRGPDKQLA